MPMTWTQTVAGAPTWTTASLSSVDVTLPEGDEETVTLNAAHPVGYDATGRLVINSDTAGSITGFSTPSVQQGGLWVHGAGVDVYGDELPWDERASTTPTSGNGTIAYAGNVDPGATGSPISWTAGERKVITKAISRTGVANGVNGLLQDLIVICILPSSACFDGMLAPGMSDPDMPIFDSADLDETIFRSLSRPANFPTYAQINATLPDITRPDIGCTRREGIRRLQNFRKVNSSDSSVDYINYSGDTTKFAVMRMWSLHYLTGTERSDMLLKVVRRGLDAYAAIRRGFVGGSGAGQHHDQGEMECFITALALGDADMLAAVQAVDNNALAHPRTVVEGDIGRFVKTIAPRNQLSRYRKAYFAQDLGRPWWTEPERGSQVTARYTEISLPTGVIEAFPVLLCQDGDLADGVDALTAGRDATAILGMYDAMKSLPESQSRWTTFAGFPNNPNYANGLSSWASNVAGYSWTGYPYAVDLLVNNFAGQQTFVAAAGGASWTSDDDLFNGNQTITDRRVSMSLDGKQFVDYDGQAESGSITAPLVGTPIYFALSKQNASGWGLRSWNNPVAEEDVPDVFGEPDYAFGERNLVTPTPLGSETAAAPVSVAAPAILVETLPYSGTDHWTALADGATLGPTQNNIHIGAGLYSGYPVPTRTITLQYEATDLAEDWTDIAGGPAFDLATVSPNLTNKRLRGEVEKTNATGTLTEYTGIIRVPDVPALDAGVLVDMSFPAFSPIHYPDTFASFSAVAATLVFAPGLKIDGANTGAIVADKTAGAPAIEFTGSGSDFPAGTYRIEAEAIMGVDAAGDENLWDTSNGIRFRVWNDGKSNEYVNDTSANNPPIVEGAAPVIVTYDEEVTTSGGLVLSWLNRTSTGGTSKGDVVLTYLKITSL